MDDNISSSEKRKCSDSEDDKAASHDAVSCSGYCWLDEDTEIGNRNMNEYRDAKKYKSNLTPADELKGKKICLLLLNITIEFFR